VIPGLQVVGVAGYLVVVSVPLLFATGGVGNPVEAFAGWYRPTQPAAQVLVSAGDVGTPSYFFAIDNPVNTRLLNYWSGVYDVQGGVPPLETGTWALAWAAVVDPGDPAPLCRRLATPEALVWTSPSGARELEQSCGQTEGEIRIHSVE
jgi:hypothetical protein